MKHVARRGEADGVATEKSLVSEVSRDHALADAIGTEQDDVRRFVDEAEAEQLVDQFAVDLLGPVPVEVRHGFEGADRSVAEPALEASAFAFGFFDLDEARQPAFTQHVTSLGEKPIKAKPPEPLAHPVSVRVHRL